MDEINYQKFTKQLIQNLTGDSRVIGLVALGSMANLSRRDRWSDHDFFAIVEAGMQQTFRENLQWLPHHERIVIAYQETDHGLKVIYDDAHVLEFAVFDAEELLLARVNDYAVLLDKASIGETFEKIEKISRHVTPRTDDYYWGQFLAHLVVGIGRYLRGEHLSGHVFVKQYALADILPLFANYSEPNDGAKLDNLDAYRRFESAFPEIGASLNNILLQPVPQACTQLLALMQVSFSHLSSFPSVGIETVKQYIEDEIARL